MKRLFLNIYNLIFARQLYIIADWQDSSITLSKRLCKHINVFDLDTAKVMMLSIPASEAKPITYVFVVNPSLDEETQLADIQYNTKYKCIGFETLVPTVAKILHDYGIDSLPQKVKMSVRVRRTKNGIVYYEIMRPYGKSLGQLT